MSYRMNDHVPKQHDIMLYSTDRGIYVHTYQPLNYVTKVMVLRCSYHHVSSLKDDIFHYILQNIFLFRTLSIYSV